MQSAYTILSSVACTALQYSFSHYLINGTILKKVKENRKCVLNFSTISFETFVILIRNGRDMIIDVYRSSRKVPVSLLYLSET